MTAPRVLDPHAVPVVGSDSHLPPLPASVLTASAVARRFAQGDPWEPEFQGDAVSESARPRAAAAVLVGLVERPSGLHVLLTRRSAHLRDHAGQISFPGGRAEASDLDPADTALREAREEVGLARRCSTVLGQLPVYSTISNFVVTPVVALVRPPFDLTIDPFEVAEAFEVPLTFLMDPAHHRRHRFSDGASQRHFLSMAWRAEAPGDTSQEYFIWGATAAMLRNLYRFLGG